MSRSPLNFCYRQSVFLKVFYIFGGGWWREEKEASIFRQERMSIRVKKEPAILF